MISQELAGIVSLRPLGQAVVRGFVRRDTLCALFWPDSDDGRARGALSQALSRIRRYAGQDVFELRGKSEIQVTPGAVECDVLAFEEGVATGDSERALDLYAGPGRRHRP